MKKVIKYIVTLVLCSLIGYLLIVLSYCLPVDSIEQNVLVTSKTYTLEWDFPNIIKNNDATKIGNNTDELMLLESIYDGNESVFEKAVMVYRNQIPGNDYKYTMDNLDNVFKDAVNTERISYPRYWHGYLVVLKPLLMLFNHNQIKYINTIIQSILLLYVLFLMYKNDLKKYIIIFLLANLILYPMTIALTMQYSLVYYILLIELVLLLKYKYLRDNFYFYIFISGILTCYFDYFTWPLVTLCIPLIFQILINNNNFKENLKFIILSSLLWVSGYAGMWIMKFSIGSLITGENLFLDGINQVLYRSSALDANHSATMESIRFNMSNMLLNRVNIVLVISLLVSIFIFVIRKKWKLKKDKILNNIPILILSLYPIVWFEVISNHSYGHYYMVYRILMITFFGIYAFLFSLFEENDSNPKSIDD